MTDNTPTPSSDIPQEAQENQLVEPYGIQELLTILPFTPLQSEAFDAWKAADERLSDNLPYPGEVKFTIPVQRTNGVIRIDDVDIYARFYGGEWHILGYGYNGAKVADE